ncbi:hypothetical protein GVX82_04875, partial [Patescibacteria group bacterium]|nr:hypothetical protein [Patescibacteria group bacterium]
MQKKTFTRRIRMTMGGATLAVLLCSPFLGPGITISVLALLAFAWILPLSSLGWLYFVSWVVATQAPFFTHGVQNRIVLSLLTLVLSGALLYMAYLGAIRLRAVGLPPLLMLTQVALSPVIFIFPSIPQLIVVFLPSILLPFFFIWFLYFRKEVSTPRSEQEPTPYERIGSWAVVAITMASWVFLSVVPTYQSITTGIEQMTVRESRLSTILPVDVTSGAHRVTPEEYRSARDDYYAQAASQGLQPSDQDLCFQVTEPSLIRISPLVPPESQYDYSRLLVHSEATQQEVTTRSRYPATNPCVHYDSLTKEYVLADIDDSSYLSLSIVTERFDESLGTFQTTRLPLGPWESKHIREPCSGLDPYCYEMGFSYFTAGGFDIVLVSERGTPSIDDRAQGLHLLKGATWFKIGPVNSSGVIGDPEQCVL